MKLLGIISVGFFCIYQILEKKWEYNETVQFSPPFCHFILFCPNIEHRATYTGTG
jgi:hypothetical protein